MGEDEEGYLRQSHVVAHPCESRTIANLELPHMEAISYGAWMVLRVRPRTCIARPTRDTSVFTDQPRLQTNEIGRVMRKRGDPPLKPWAKRTETIKWSATSPGLVL